MINPGTFAFGLTYPEEVEPGRDVVASAREFADLAAVPRRDGGAVDLRTLPLAESSESLVQLCGSDGQVDVTNLDEAYRFSLRWDPRQLPSYVLWISNAGRRNWPWNGRHYALGVEPVCAAFDLGVSASVGANAISARAIPTSLSLRPEVPLVIDYRLGVSTASEPTSLSIAPYFS
ncbi:hypothetical protein [Paraburkholderia oxyphila]|uniref:hypothetical protein n=1 Tax=Paraburkholderia oxyphila TaxID=614212 RepID=UPI000AFF83CE|nr:hypothetical protein [Paraburkholderia oxyphila]